VELKELITGAQEAMDQGDYRLAIAASEHALVGYDACLAAHRMLGEAYLERGDQQSAIAHFQRTLAIDPLNVVAQLGLGVASEETRRYEEAYAHYLSAWENNPALDQVRDELVRLRGVLDVDERLHPTRAGLAGIHTRTGQFARAAAEWRAILAVEPDSARARTALAELLWRQGDDAGAAAAAREAMRGCPENARALAILADIETRRGGGTAADLAQRFCGVDPTGEVLAILRGWRSDADLSSLLPESILIDEFDFERHRTRQTSGLSRKSITGSLATSQMAAPDLWDTLVNDLNTGAPSKPAPTLATAVEPFNWTDGQPAEAAPEIIPTAAPALPDDSDIFPELALLGDDIAPFDPGDPEPVAVLDSESAPMPESVDVVPEWNASAHTEIPDAAASAAADADLDLDLVPFSLDEITGTVAPAHALDESVLSASFGTLPEPEPVSEPQTATSVSPALPVDEPGADPVLPAYDDPFVTADGRIDLTAGWDKLDRELEAATPSANGDGGFDALLAELGVDGVVPFDAVIESADEDAWSPFSDGDFDAPVAEISHAADSDIPSVDLLLPDASGDALDLADVEALDVNAFLDPIAEPVHTAEATPALGSDILAGIPHPEPSGYTQLLRNIDEESLPEHDAGDNELDPFANPDASGAPLAFDELIGVTSSDGTGPLSARSEELPAEIDLVAALDFSQTDLSTAVPAAEAEPFDFEVDGIEPFDSAGFDLAADASVDDIAFVAEPLAAEMSPPAAVLPDEPLAADLGDVAPFAFDDGAGNQADGAPMDFSELDVAPEPMIFSPAAAQPAESFDFDESEAEPLEFEPAANADAVDDPGQAVDWTSEDADAARLDVAAEQVEGADEPAAAEIEFEVEEEHEPELVAAACAGNGLRSVPWPQFMGQTSELIDRPLESGSLFTRIAAQKEALVEMGVVSTGRRLSPMMAAPEPRIIGGEPSPVIEAPVAVEAEPSTGMSDQPNLDLMAMRVRLIEDESAAREIADTLEAAIADGLQTPLALRVLGEAYLKLGMVERAAAQFRQAMLTRRRGA
jgi:Tfp pilus assembly protein PilF